MSPSVMTMMNFAMKHFPHRIDIDIDIYMSTPWFTTHYLTSPQSFDIEHVCQRSSHRRQRIRSYSDAICLSTLCYAAARLSLRVLLHQEFTILSANPRERARRNVTSQRYSIPAGTHLYVQWTRPQKPGSTTIEVFFSDRT